MAWKAQWPLTDIFPNKQQVQAPSLGQMQGGPCAAPQGSTQSQGASGSMATVTGDRGSMWWL